MNKIPFIEKGQYGRIDFQSSGKHRPIKLFIAYLIFVMIFFLILLGRLFQLTIVKGVYYRNLSDQNRVREIIIEPQRGTLVDRKGIVLVENRPSNVKEDSVRIQSQRTYLQQPETYAHVIGYRQIADTYDIKNDRCLNKLKVGDKVGKKGVEKLFECDLRGISGKKLMEVDARGQFIKTLSIVEPQAGKKLQLSLDSVLQQKAYDLIQKSKAVVIGLKPKTGEVLVLTSSPSFNPQSFEDADTEMTNKYIKDPEKPLFNRATEGTYPPGSTFKIVLAAGALQDKVVTPQTLFEDNGFIKAGQAIFHNWYYLQYGKTEGQVDIIKAIQRSNDIYFYMLGAKMGPEKIKKWAEEFGYQSKSDIGIEEAEGTIPSPFWKEDVLKEQWYLGDTYNLSIGQGYLVSTPIQVAVSTAVFANGGYICKPNILKQSIDAKTEKLCKKLSISEENINIVREGMLKACQTGGTGWPLFEFKIKDEFEGVTSPTPTDSTSSATLDNTKYKSVQIGCKTGTAESHAESGKPHAWFTVFAPYENPEIVLTVLVEEGGQGSDVAAPIAKEILKTYFERDE